MLKLKACPRCKGDLIINQNGHAWSEQCLQCGYERELRSMVSMPKRTGEEADRAKSV